MSATSRTGRIVLPVLTVAAAGAAWEVLPRVGVVRRASFPPLSTVLAEAGHVLGDHRFREDLQASAGRWTAGVLLAVLLGTVVGVAMGRSKVAFHLVDPVLAFLFPVPKAAFVLPLVLWFGVGDTARISIIVIGSVIPIVISAHHGAAGIDPKLLWSARSLGLSQSAAVAKVIVPAALPEILSGIRLALTTSIFTLLGAELLIRQSGIGSYLFTNLDNGQYERVWATSFVIASLGFAVDLAFVGLVRRTVPWHEGEV